RYQEEVRKEILATPGMNTYSIATAEEYLSTISPARLPGLNIGLGVVIGIAGVVGFLVIFQAMSTAVMERTREIGILKSMGASRSYIVGVVLRETVLLALAGTALGIGISYLAKFLLTRRFHAPP